MGFKAGFAFLAALVLIGIGEHEYSVLGDNSRNSLYSSKKTSMLEIHSQIGGTCRTAAQLSTTGLTLTMQKPPCFDYH